MKIIARFLLVLCLVVAGAAHEITRAQTPPPVQGFDYPEPRDRHRGAPVAPGLGQPSTYKKPKPPRQNKKKPSAPVVPGLSSPAPKPPPRDSGARGQSSPDGVRVIKCEPLSRVPAEFKLACRRAILLERARIEEERKKR